MQQHLFVQLLRLARQPLLPHALLDFEAQALRDKGGTAPALVSSHHPLQTHGSVSRCKPPCPLPTNFPAPPATCSARRRRRDMCNTGARVTGRHCRGTGGSGSPLRLALSPHVCLRGQHAASGCRCSRQQGLDTACTQHCLVVGAECWRTNADALTLTCYVLPIAILAVHRPRVSGSHPGLQARGGAAALHQFAQQPRPH